MNHDIALTAAIVFLGVIQLFIAIGLWFVYYTITQSMFSERQATGERFKEMHRGMMDLSGEVRQIKDWFVSEFRRRPRPGDAEPPKL